MAINEEVSNKPKVTTKSNNRPITKQRGLKNRDKKEKYPPKYSKAYQICLNNSKLFCSPNLSLKYVGKPVNQLRKLHLAWNNTLNMNPEVLFKNFTQKRTPDAQQKDVKATR